MGIALCDDLTRIPVPHAIWKKAQGEAEKKLRELVGKNPGSSLVVGLPLDADGNETNLCKMIRNFCRRVSSRLSAEIFLVDENGSSEEAKERLKTMGKKANIELDHIAACIILERFLDQSKNYHVGPFKND